VPAPPDSWTEEELYRDATRARGLFVKERLAAVSDERLIYQELHREHAIVAQDLLVATNNLLAITAASLGDRKRLQLARYMAVPPISLDDLDTLTGGNFEAWVGQTTEAGERPTATAFQAAAEIIAKRVDTARAPWASRASQKPTTNELKAFITWAASLPASQGVATKRRNLRAALQEDLTRQALAAARYQSVVLGRTFTDPIAQMLPGTYSARSRALRRTSMDVPVRLRDGHPSGHQFLAIECKVSNSALNSRKRLLEVSRKRQVWDNAGLRYRYRTAAVLAGVFDVDRLSEVQEDGVMIVWEHRLQDLTRYVR